MWNAGATAPVSLAGIAHSQHGTGYTADPTMVLESQARNPTPYALRPTPDTRHPTPYTLHPAPRTLHPTHYTLHPTPYTLHPTPYTLHPTPHTLHTTSHSQKSAHTLGRLRTSKLLDAAFRFELRAGSNSDATSDGLRVPSVLTSCVFAACGARPGTA